MNPGNSGGPLFNLQGEVIGVVSHIETRSGGNEGLGFAVSSNTVRELLLQRENYWTGLTGVTITPELARAVNYPFNHGMLIQTIASDSFAERLGLREGLIPQRSASVNCSWVETSSYRSQAYRSKVTESAGDP
ncbi:MAG: trypsin-like serine protease [Candidatus Thiodiazotropha sp.]